MAWTFYADGGIAQKNTVTIANGASVSDSVFLGGMILSRIEMPSAWTTAALTAQISPDGGSTWTELYISDAAWSIASGVVAASISLALPPATGAQFQGTVRFRSGTSGAAVNQGGARTITLIALQLAAG